jgi:hypothetical protein
MHYRPVCNTLVNSSMLELTSYYHKSINDNKYNII